jgi:hypothetical protein
MANQPHQFKHRDVVRAFKAAAAAGVRDPQVEIQFRNGTTIVIGPRDAGAKSDVGATPKPTKPRSSASARTPANVRTSRPSTIS